MLSEGIPLWQENRCVGRNPFVEESQLFINLSFRANLTAKLEREVEKLVPDNANLAPTRMGNFVVSARKYRPQKFSEVVGQESITTTLENALRTDHLAHAFLFCGPRGVGKTTCARILARTLNCENVQNEVDPCEECSSCKAFIKNASFNIIELDAASHNSVDDMRTLNEQVRFPPQEGKYKVYIIDEVHMLSQSAFNAFLKTLEEPPAHAIFILATTEKHKILPTILSRCQIFDFKRIQVRDTIKHLEEICVKEGIEAESDALAIIAQKSDGALRDALSLFDRLASVEDKKITYRSVVANLNLLDYDVFFKTADACLREDVRDVLLIIDKVLNDGFEGDAFLNGLASHFRDLLVCQDPRTIHLQDHSETLKQRYLDQAALMSTSYLFSALNLINETDVTYPQAQNKRLHVEMALSKVCFINRATMFAPFHTEKKTADVTEPESRPAVSTISQPRIPVHTPVVQKDAPKENIPASISPADEDIQAKDNPAQKPSAQESVETESANKESVTKIITAPASPAPASPAVANQMLEAGPPASPAEPEQAKERNQEPASPAKSRQAKEDNQDPTTSIPRLKDIPSINIDVNASTESAPKAAPAPSPNPRDTSTTGLDNKLSGLSIDIPKLGDISDIQKSVISEEKEARANSLEFTLENVQKWWDDYRDRLISPSAMSTFKSTKISLKEKIIVLEVHSQVAKSRINEELDILTMLRKDFHMPTLLIEFVINESAESLENQPKKPLTSKEKYELLLTKNPNLKKLRESLDLAVDNEQ